MAWVYSRTDQLLLAPAHWYHNFIMFDQIQIYFRMWRHNNTTALSSCPGALENIPLTSNSPEDLNPIFHLLCNEHPRPDSQVLDFEYLPYYRTSHICVCPAAHICTEREESFYEGRTNTKQDEQVSYSATSTGYFPHGGTSEELLGQPLTYGLYIWLNWVKYLQIRFRWTHL